MSTLAAGLMAAIPLAVILVVYTLIRGKALVALFREQEASQSAISEKAFFWILLGGFVLFASILGAISGLVYARLGVPTFRYLAFGMAVLLSLIAVISKTPMAVDKVIWNLAAGGILGWLVPIFGS